MDSATALARGLVRLRKAQGLTQAELAERADISVQFVAALEHEQHTPSLTTLDSLARALGVRTSGLFGAGEGKARRKAAPVEELEAVLDGLAPWQIEHVMAIAREARKLAIGARRNKSR